MTNQIATAAAIIARLDSLSPQLAQPSDEGLETAADLLIAMQHRTAGFSALRKLLQAERERTIAAIRAELAI